MWKLVYPTSQLPAEKINERSILIIIDIISYKAKYLEKSTGEHGQSTF